MNFIRCRPEWVDDIKEGDIIRYTPEPGDSLKYVEGKVISRIDKEVALAILKTKNVSFTKAGDIIELYLCTCCEKYLEVDEEERY